MKRLIICSPKTFRWVAVVEWLAPDILVFGATIAVYFTTKKLSTPTVPQSASDSDAVENGNLEAASINSMKSLPAGPNFDRLIKICKCCVAQK